MIKVFIVDDNALIREGIKRVFSECPDISVVGEAKNVGESLFFLEENDVDILILEIAPPGTHGLKVLGDIERDHSRVKVLVLSACSENQFVFCAFKSGASGYLSKESAADEIIDAVHAIATGGIYVSRKLGENLAGRVRNRCSAPPHKMLSGREFQVFLLVAQGRSTKEIAYRLKIRLSTVSTYRFRIMKKLNVATTADVVRYALQYHLIE